MWDFMRGLSGGYEGLTSQPPHLETSINTGVPGDLVRYRPIFVNRAKIRMDCWNIHNFFAKKFN